MDFNVITENFKKGFEVWKDNIVAYLVGYILLAVLVGVIGAIAIFGGAGAALVAISSGSTAGITAGLIIGLIALLVAFLLLSPLYFGLYYMAIKGTRGEKVEIKDLFYAFKSKSVYVRSLIYVIIMAIVGVIIGIIGAILAFIPILGALLVLILGLAVAILFFYTIYIYIMTPSEGVIYALKQSFNVAKGNLVLTIIAIIIALILMIIPIVSIFTTTLAYVFIAYMLKDLKPDLKDESGM